jgi:hypothetical protein
LGEVKTSLLDFRRIKIAQGDLGRTRVQLLELIELVIQELE